tara:strand:+ start:805 stop:1149 length:345 start_codon:yes stop_codon:yes gene_type:complete
MSHLQEKLLGQARENSTNAVNVYTLAANTTVIIKAIILCNQTGGAVTFRVFADADGTTYDQSTAIQYDVALAANTTLVLDFFTALSTTGGSIGYRSSVANAVTITLFGAEVTST